MTDFRIELFTKLLRGHEFEDCLSKKEMPRVLNSTFGSIRQDFVIDVEEAFLSRVDESLNPVTE